MTLEKLLSGIDVLSTNADLNQEISDIKTDSKKLENNDIFVAISGLNFDANSILDSIDKDVVVISEKPSQKHKYVQVKNARATLSVLSRNFFDNPTAGMKFVAVVGTNGKTSSSHYLSSILSFAGIKTGLIGTEGHYILGEKVGESLTTPDPYEFFELLHKMQSKGVEVVISEVSAHAIYLDKMEGIVADVALFTNITQDHLDFFNSYKNYEGVKMSYFDKKYVKSAILNADDKCFLALSKKLEDQNVPFVSYGLENPADSFAINMKGGFEAISFLANIDDEIIDTKTNLYGVFNAYNLLLAMTCAKQLGLNGLTIANACRKIRAVKGRFSVLKNDKGNIIIDYAHTPDGLQNLLSTSLMLTKSRLITVFGCGGDRDRTKRKPMGKIASDYSDFVVVTSDNPRYENAGQILQDIECGLSKNKYRLIENRADAIKFAISEMDEGDTVVIAGKGNEKYIDKMGKKIPFCDFDVVKRWGKIR